MITCWISAVARASKPSQGCQRSVLGCWGCHPRQYTLYSSGQDSTAAFHNRWKIQHQPSRENFSAKWPKGKGFYGQSLPFLPLHAAIRSARGPIVVPLDWSYCHSALQASTLIIRSLGCALVLSLSQVKADDERIQKQKEHRQQEKAGKILCKFLVHNEVANFMLSYSMWHAPFVQQCCLILSTLRAQLEVAANHSLAQTQITRDCEEKEKQEKIQREQERIKRERERLFKQQALLGGERS